MTGLWHLLGIVFVILKADALNADQGDISKQISHHSLQVKAVSEEKLALENEVAKLKEEIAEMKALLGMSAALHNNNIETRGIEADVQQNKEDIISLKVTDDHHDYLIQTAMSDTKYINFTIIPNLKTDLEEQMHDRNEFVDATRPPIGSIVAWLPEFSLTKQLPYGWQRCDGSLIKSGLLKGRATPDLNTSGRFLRGSSDGNAGVMQDDAVQDHTHLDDGHTHQDGGHSHTDSGHDHYMDSHDDGTHFAPFFGSDEEHSHDTMCSHDYHENCGGWFLRSGEVWTTEANKAQISTNQANIQSSSSGLSGMGTGKVADETRPKNMAVVYIMRVQ